MMSSTSSLRKVTRMLTARTLAFAVLIAAAAAMSTGARAGDAIRFGVLTCDISAGVGLIFTEKQEMGCTFTPDNGGAVDVYSGTIQEFGLELGETNGAELTWLVFSLQNGVPKGALAGTYVGLSANASVGAGIGANSLNGGLERSIVLQPYSVQTQTGVNLAAGVAKVVLREAD
jgi:hypothetical protein